MGERVGSFRGKEPIIIVVPHGHDDPNTVEIGEQIISELGAYGVINYGWERSPKYDYYNDKANCNNINHIHEDVVDSEFLKPILNYAAIIGVPNIFIIHGVSNLIKKQVPHPLDMIVGYGLGKKQNSITAREDYVEYFIKIAQKAGYHMWVGKGGGNYSGRSKENLNQLFVQWYFNPYAFSVQIEIVKELRKTKHDAKVCGDQLANIIQDTVTCRLKNSFPTTNYSLLNSTPQI